MAIFIFTTIIFFFLLYLFSVPSKAALTIGLGGAEAPGPEQRGGPW